MLCGINKDMSNDNISTVIFDFGGVLSQQSNTWDTDHKNIVMLTGLSASELTKLSNKHWPALETGREDVWDFWKDVLANSNENINEHELEDVYEHNFQLNDRVVELAKRLKEKGFTIVILSNASRTWLNRKLELLGIDKLFHKVYNSAEIGLIKPSTKVFEFMLRDMGVAADECVFIDDSQENVSAAIALNLKSILYDNPSDLANQLQKYVDLS